MPRRVDKIKLVNFSIEGFVIQRYALRFDRYSTLALQFHGIQYLVFHFAIRKRTTHLDKAIRQGRFTMVDMRNDGKVSDVVLVHSPAACLASDNNQRAIRFK